MAYFTELFTRPRADADHHYRLALDLLNGMSNADRADIGIKPADFPKIARQMATRRPN